MEEKKKRCVICVAVMWMSFGIFVAISLFALFTHKEFLRLSSFFL